MDSLAGGGRAKWGKMGEEMGEWCGVAFGAWRGCLMDGEKQGGGEDGELVGLRVKGGV